MIREYDGARVEAQDFEPFGGIMPGRSYASGSNTKEKFTGKERDAEPGLDYFIPLRSISRREE